MGNNSSTTKAGLVKFYMQIRFMMIHICYKFPEIQIVGYLLMAKYGNFTAIKGQ